MSVVPTAINKRALDMRLNRMPCDGMVICLNSPFVIVVMKNSPRLTLTKCFKRIFD